MNPFTGVLLNVREPGSDVYERSASIDLIGYMTAGLTVKRTFVGHVVDKQDPHSTTVVCCSDGTKAFLACCIPDLEFHSFPVQLDRADLEINSDSRDERWSERIFAETQETTRFAHARVSDQQKLDL